VKALVARSCPEQAPDQLREKVLLRIREVHLSLQVTRDVDSTTAP
jgi:hypothetical protein